MSLTIVGMRLKFSSTAIHFHLAPVGNMDFTTGVSQGILEIMAAFCDLYL